MKSKQKGPFNAQAFLDSAGIARKIVEYRRAEAEVIFAQGDPCEHVLYIQSGSVKLSVLSNAGREAVVAMDLACLETWVTVSARTDSRSVRAGTSRHQQLIRVEGVGQAPQEFGEGRPILIGHQLDEAVDPEGHFFDGRIDEASAPVCSIGVG